MHGKVQQWIGLFHVFERGKHILGRPDFAFVLYLPAHGGVQRRAEAVAHELDRLGRKVRYVFPSFPQGFRPGTFCFFFLPAGLKKRKCQSALGP